MALALVNYSSSESSDDDDGEVHEKGQISTEISSSEEKKDGIVTDSLDDRRQKVVGGGAPVDEAPSLPLPLPNLSSFVPSGAASVFQQKERSPYESMKLPGRTSADRGSHDATWQPWLQQGSDQDVVAEFDHDDDAEPTTRKKRKRHGVTNTLEPPKKARTELRAQIHKNQPWMKRT